MAEQDPVNLTDILLGSAPRVPPLELSNDPDFMDYLTELPKSPLQTLLSTPQSLTTQSHTLTSSLTSLTHTSYPTFLSLHTTTNSLRSSLASLSSSLDTLIDECLPALDGAAKEFKERSGPEVLGERTKARVVLEQHDKLRDLLDVPVLIDTCVRNGMYSEALSLASHASSSLTSLSSSSEPLPLAISLNASISHSLRTMLSILLSTLREPGPARKLPALWKAVNFIRRMEVLEEDELALAFLSGRGECLNVALASLGRDYGVVGPGEEGKGGARRDAGDAEDIARFLRKYIDIWREGVYDIITQYTTIFLERSSNASTTPTSPSPNPIATKSHMLLYTLLTTYASHALTSLLLPTLQHHLPHTPSALPSLLTQLTYCATAFARVGLDFRGILDGMFSDAVRDIVGREIREAGSKWSHSIQTVRRKRGPEEWLINPELVSSPPTGSLFLDTPPHVPPQILASYPPIAEYTNALLTSLNGLRLLAPVRIIGDLLTILDEVLADSGTVFLSHVQNGEHAEGTSQEVSKAAGKVFVRIFVPFVRRALLEGVYGVKVASGEAEKFQVGAELGNVCREWESWLDLQTDS
jgi:conserved oligomeric Golgi complex subunit 8